MQSVTFAVHTISSSLDAWYVAWQCVLDNTVHVFSNENKENNFQNLGKKISDNNGPKLAVVFALKWRFFPMFSRIPVCSI